MFLSYAVVQAV